MAIYPIWKDVIIAGRGVGASFGYTITLNNEEIYKGFAHSSPNSLVTTFNLSAIAKDYLSSKITFSTASSQEVSTWKGVFKVVDNKGNALASHTLYNDWSYRTEYAESAISLAEPIINYVDPRQLVVTSVGNLSQIESVSVAITVGSVVRFEGSVKAFMTTTAKILNDSDAGKVLKVLVEGVEVLTADIKRTNAKYCLYYMNTHGGYDSFLVRGNSMRSDAYERTNIRRSVSGNMQHGKDTILNTITTKWELYTDYLTDTQYQRLHHLLGSTSVYLHDLESDEIVPVIVTNNMTNYHTYTNQGRKMSYVKIDVESAQEHMRI